MSWIGVDLDGTLAEYHGWVSPYHIGKPIPLMVARVKAWLEKGVEVRIVTARAFPYNWLKPEDDLPLYSGQVVPSLRMVQAIQQWCLQHIGQKLPITCMKDYEMVELWDDRAVQVVPNTGQRVDGCSG